jgi:hypothetical protein
MVARKIRLALSGMAAVSLIVGGSASAASAVSGIAAPLACSALQVGVASVAQLNVAATQGCVLPIMDQVAQAPTTEPVVEPVAAGLPQRAVGVPRGLILAGALAAGLAVAAVASSGSNGRLPVSA